MVVPAQWIAQPVTRALIAWNGGALLYLVLAFTMMARSSINHMRSRARLQDEGAGVVLVLVIWLSLVTLFAITAELSTAKNFTGPVKTGHVVLAGVTILTAWLVMQIMFALHYANQYYLAQADDRRGLDFPGKDPPDYFDFFYASATIGTSGQTADISFNTRSLRRVGLVHSILAFFFNTFLLALAINIAANLM